MRVALLLLAIAVIGAALQRLLFRERLDAPARWRLGGAAFGLGAGVVHWVTLVGSRGGERLPLEIPWLLAPPSLALLVWCGWRARGGSRAGGPAATRLEMAQAALLLALLLAVGAQGVLQPLTGFDSRAIYATTARILYHEGGVLGEAIQDPARIHYHRNYPLLVPHLEALAFHAQGAVSERGPKPIFPLCFASLVALFYGALRPALTRWATLLMCLVVASPPFAAFFLDGGAVSGYADVPLAYLWGGCVIHLLLYLQRRDWRYAALGGIFLGAAVCTKNEALPLALALVAIFAAACLAAAAERRSARAPALCAAVAAIVALPWLAIRAQLPAVLDESYLTGLLAQGPRATLAALPQVADAMTNTHALARQWGHLWWFLLAAPLIGWGVADRRTTLFLVAVIAAQLGLYALAYAATPHDLVWHVDVSWNRLLIHVLPVAALCAGVQLQGAVGGESGGPGRRAASVRA